MTTILNRDTDTAVELHRILTASLTRRFGLTEIVASALADEIALEIRNEAGGSDIYIPAPNREVRNAQIRAAFKGNNYDELVSRFGISRRQIERIVSESDNSPLKMSHTR